MTIYRSVFNNDGELLERKVLIPGYEEIISPTLWKRRIRNLVMWGVRDEVIVKVESDDDIDVINRRWDEGMVGVVGKPKKHKLSRESINEHTVEGDPTLFGEVTRFEWVESPIGSSPEALNVNRRKGRNKEAGL